MHHFADPPKSKHFFSFQKVYRARHSEHVSTRTNMLERTSPSGTGGLSCVFHAAAAPLTAPGPRIVKLEAFVA